MDTKKQLLIAGKEAIEADRIIPLNPGNVTPCVFIKNGKAGIINCAGQVILPPEYEEIGSFGNGFVYTKRDGKYGLICPYIDVLDPQFDSIEIDSKDDFLVTLDGRKGYIDCEGNFTEDVAEAYLNHQMGI